jgi:hypothetical protein
MIEITFLVPIVRNSDRKEHCSTAWDHLEGRMFDLFDGFTRCEDVVGSWRNEHGTVVKDTSRQYKVAISSDKEGQFWDFLEQSKGVFDQMCIYAAITSKEAYLV